MEVEEEKENIKDKEDNSIILENQDKKIESLESLDGFKKIIEEKPEILKNLILIIHFENILLNCCIKIKFKF